MPSDGAIRGVEAGAAAVVLVLARPGSIAGSLSGFANPPIVVIRTGTRDLRFGILAIVDGATFSQRGLPIGPCTVLARDGAQTATAEVD